MRRKILVFVCLLVIALMVASSVPVGAKGKPPKDPPPDDGSDPTGTIYYFQSDEVDGGSTWTMDADGSNKQELSFYKGEISLTTHKDDHYWHVYFKALDDTHPDGKKRHEIRAVRDDGTENCLLRYDENWVHDQFAGPICWMTDDDYISWVTWKINDDWTIYDQGVYKAEMYWGDDDNSPSLGTPVRVYASGTWYDDYLEAYRASASYPNWSSDGSKLLYTHWDGGKVLVDFSTSPATETAYDYNGNHAISPDGTRMFFVGGGESLIVMDIDGTDKETIFSVAGKKASNANIGWIYWSPDSNHIAYGLLTTPSNKADWNLEIYVIGADGSGNDKLTQKTRTCSWYMPRSWR